MIFILVQKLYRATIYKQCHYSVVTDVEILICYEHGYVIYMLPQHLCTAVYIFTVFNGMTNKTIDFPTHISRFNLQTTRQFFCF